MHKNIIKLKKKLFLLQKKKKLSVKTLNKLQIKLHKEFRLDYN